MTLTPTRDDTSESVRTPLEQRLQDPAVAGALISLLDHADLIALLVEGLDQFVERSEVIGDNLISGVSELRTAIGNTSALADSGVDLGALAHAGASLAAVLPKATPGLVAAIESGAIDKLFASGVVGPEAVDQVALLAKGLVGGGRAFRTRPVEVGGVLSVLKLLKDPDINRAISFFATVAQSIGREIAAAPAPSTSPASPAGQPVQN